MGRLPADAEARETAGVTSRLLLMYAEMQGGRDAVEQVLAHAGCTGREAQLRDESTWFSFATKVRLFEALCAVLGDPHAVRHAGEAALELNTGEGLKVALRALGSPRLVYQHIVRANAKFTAIHTMELLELGRDKAVIAFHDNVGYDVHPLDCEYNQGLLAIIPRLFGLDAARLRHPVCAAEGAERCVYELSWDRAAVTPRMLMTTGLAAGGSLAAAALAAPVLLPAAVAGSVAAAGALAWRSHAGHKARWVQLEQEVHDKEEVSAALTASLQDLVSELDLEELLAKIVRNARAAVGGKDFVLLVEEDGRLRCRSSSDVDPASIERLEAWATDRVAGVTEPFLVEDVSIVPGLAPLAQGDLTRVGSVCLAPLAFRGTPIGHLVALAKQARTFLPRDVDLVHSYAMQAAIALANARIFAAQRALATRDPLTGLHNHREFHESVDSELQRARRHGGAMAVALFDLDGFKFVNDGAGHAEGDRVLRAVADAMAQACRTEDTPFRIGGDEFALVLPETGPEEAAIVTARVSDAIAGVDARVGTSSGIAAWPQDGGSKDVLLAQADANLYLMKGSARRAPRRPVAASDLAGAGPGDASLQRQRLALAARLSGKLAPVLDPERIARAAVAELADSFDYMLAYVQRIEDGALQVVAVDGGMTNELAIPLWTQRLDQGVCARVARTGAVALVHDAELDADHVGAEIVFPDTDIRLRSQLAVPLRVGGQVWGVLSIEDTARSAFGADDVLLVETVGAQVGAALHRSELFAELDTAFATKLGALCDALELKDEYTADHAAGVGDLAHRVGTRLGLAEDQLRDVRYGALLHDIGKIAVPSEILAKPGPLTPAQRTEMEKHAAAGARLLERIPFFATIHPLVRSSHERWDGAGYPDRLAGEEIPFGARIIGACDAFHAMTSDRPYRSALGLEAAVEELRRNAGTQFDPSVVVALVAEVTVATAAAAT